MKTRTLTVILLTLMTLISIGFAFATIDNSYACKCKNCKVIFTYVEFWDNEIEKNVGQVCAWVECETKIKISICNAYPCYTAYINFTMKNKGNLDAHIDEVSIESPPEALETMLNPNLECIWIEPCHTIEGQLAVHILQTAQECHTYTFEITIKYSCGERPHPRTIGFWKNQFDKALCKGGNPQVPSATLLAYLNEISAQSPCFEFTGTKTQKFQQALNILNTPNNAIMKDKLEAQLLALWLNYLAGWTEGYKYKGMTAWEIIQGSENALLSNPTNKYEYWKNMCDGFNNLG